MARISLRMFPSALDYVIEPNDPLKLYYYPVIGKLYRRRVEMCLELLPGGERVLEVGFGSGVSFFNLAELYSEIHGIDLSADNARVTTCFAAHNISVQLIQGSVLDMPYPEAFFDTVLLISILEHLKPKDLAAACREISRVLRPGGTVVYGVPVERPLMVTAFRLLGYNIREHHFSTEKDIFAALSECFAPDGGSDLRGFAGLSGPIYEARRFRKAESKA